MGGGPGAASAHTIRTDIRKRKWVIASCIVGFGKHCYGVAMCGSTEDIVSAEGLQGSIRSTRGVIPGGTVSVYPGHLTLRHEMPIEQQFMKLEFELAP